MTKCKDCKYWKRYQRENRSPICGECHIIKYPKGSLLVITYEKMGCIHAERADGLTECCETCKHYKRGDISHLDRCNYGNEFIFHPSMPRDKMKCDEWEAKAK